MSERKSWLFNLVLGILALLILFLVLYWLFPMPKLDTFYDKVFNENIQTMKVAARDYYTVNRLPVNAGETHRMTLAEMENSKLILPFVDKDNKTCDMTNSYVQVTKTLDNEYALKVQLSCGDHTDYIIDTIGCNGTCYADGSAVKDDNEGQVPTTKPSTSTNKPTTTNKPSNNTNKPTTTDRPSTNNNNNKPSTTVTKKYTVTFDTNGGTAIASQTIVSGEKVSVPGAPARDGYIFTGWYYDGKLYDFATPVTKDMTIVAHWDAKQNDTTSMQLYYQHAPIKKVYGTETLTYPGGLFDTENREVDYYYYYPNDDNSYYSVGYVTKSQYDANKNSRGVWTYSYDLELTDMRGVDATKLKVESKGRMYTLAHFEDYVDTRGTNLAMVGADPYSSANVYTTAKKMMNSSLKTDNYNVKVSDPRKVGGRYYVTITIELKRLTGVDSFQAYNVAEPIYFVPVKFTIGFTNRDKGVLAPEMPFNGGMTGTMEEAYTRVLTVYKPYTLERDMSKAIWSVSPRLENYEPTGKVEWRNK